MTNEELIERFFAKRLNYESESYGFFAKAHLWGRVGEFFLFSKAGCHPMATEAAVDCFIITRSLQMLGAGLGSNFETHRGLVISIAERMRVKFVFSPHADKAKFQEHMEKKINSNLLTLAHDLRTGSYVSAWKVVEDEQYSRVPSFAEASETCYSVPKHYPVLMENIHTLLEGEALLDLPKNQVALLDTEEVQRLWRWLIKDNPCKEDRELLQKIYILSRLSGKESQPASSGVLWGPGTSEITAFSTPK